MIPIDTSKYLECKYHGRKEVIYTYKNMIMLECGCHCAFSDTGRQLWGGVSTEKEYENWKNSLKKVAEHDTD